MKGTLPKIWESSSISPHGRGDLLTMDTSELFILGITQNNERITVYRSKLCDVVLIELITT
ncbi:hypothetical protein DLR60_15645 [Vibrio tarriae]|nr:hypothetical protein DLR60_15645 [Vibrio tarriae]